MAAAVVPVGPVTSGRALVALMLSNERVVVPDETRLSVCVVAEIVAGKVLLAVSKTFLPVCVPMNCTVYGPPLGPCTRTLLARLGIVFR